MFKVLIADDEAAVKRSLGKIIECDFPDFTVVGTVKDGEEALNFLAEFEVDLVITDILMPGMDGLQLAREIRNRGLNVEIVMISGYSDHSYYRQALRSGAAEYLLKPIDADEVTKTLNLIADKLYKQRRNLGERSDWIAVCRTKTNRLANLIWLLNNDSVFKELDILHQYVLSHQNNWIQTQEMFVILLTLLNAELIEISGDRIRLEQFAEFHQACLSDKKFDVIHRLVWKTMDEIRQVRNWGAHKIIHNALERIHQSYTDKSFSLKEVALSVGISPNYFSKCFREEVGVSFSSYIGRLRMKKAMNLLNDPMFKVYEVAHASGFSDYAHFAKVFKKSCEFSPTEYRVNIGII